MSQLCYINSHMIFAPSKNHENLAAKNHANLNF
jgi:hypothetical protein